MKKTSNSNSLSIPIVNKSDGNYRLTVTNVHDYEEIVTIKFTRFNVFALVSTLFVIGVGATIALIVLTPIKYYIPGYGGRKNRSELQTLKYKTDSIEKVLESNIKYVTALKKTLTGSTNPIRDTTAIILPKSSSINENDEQ